MKYPPLSPTEFRDLSGASAETMDRLEAYATLLGRWRRRVNLVGDASFDDLWRRHILDSAQLLPLLPAPAHRLVDLGSGAGFPGLVLAIMGGPPVHLVESNGRKCAFLEEAIRITGANAQVHHQRIEQMTPFPADVVTARALAPLPGLLGQAARFLAPGGQCLFLKGANVGRELTDSLKSWKMEVTRIASVSDPSGVVLRLEGVGRRHDR